MSEIYMLKNPKSKWAKRMIKDHGTCAQLMDKRNGELRFITPNYSDSDYMRDGFWSYWIAENEIEIEKLELKP